MIYRVLSKERMYQAEELWNYCFEKKTEPFFRYYFEQYEAYTGAPHPPIRAVQIERIIREALIRR